MTDNLLQLLFHKNTPGEAPCFIDPRGNMVRNFTREQVQEAVLDFASGMALTDIRPGKRVAMIAHTSFNSLVASWGNLLNGCVNVIIPVGATAEEQQEALAQSRAEILIVEDMETARNIMDQVMYLPQLRQIIILEQSDYEPHPSLLTFSFKDLVARGKAKPVDAAKLLSNIKPEDDAYLFYLRNNYHQLQSFTLTHEAVLEHLEASQKHYGIEKHYGKAAEACKTLAIIPFHRPFSHISGCFLPLKLGLPVMAVDRDQGWKSSSLPINPRILIAESRFFEDAIDNLKNFMMDSRGVDGKAIRKAVEWKKKISAEDKHPFSLSRLFWAPILKRRIKEKFGNSLAYVVSIDEGMDFEARAIFMAAGLPTGRAHTEAERLLAMAEPDNAFDISVTKAA
jgi:long-subunit acyl-CoA synthetase (AMP-forming)